MPNSGQPDLSGLLDVLKCLWEGPPAPPPFEPPPEGLRVRAWQDQEEAQLQLRVAGVKAADWKLEVAFDDPDAKTAKNMKSRKHEKDEKDEKDLEDDLENAEAAVAFDLPDTWTKSPGARFVTVYLRKKGKATKEANLTGRQQEPKNKPEEPTTIIRIIPAPVRQSVPDEFAELDSPAGSDD